MTAQEITELIRQSVPGEVVVRDLTGGGDHFEATVVSEEFTGKNRVARHRMIYQVLGSAMEKDIHALSLRTWTPEEFQKIVQNS